MLWTKVETSFSVGGRGCAIIPGTANVDFRIRAGNSIQLRTPEGRVLDTCIGAVEFAKTVDGTRLAIVLPAPLTRADVPDGTEIWLVQQQTTERH
jgi:hypothetical protein